MGKKGVLATPEDTQVVECAAKRAVSVRQGLIIAGVLLLACGGLVGYGILNTEDEPKAQAVPTAEVTYEVTGTGTAEISYLAPSQSGTATVEKGATLPWKKTVQVPVGKAPTVAIILDERGGEAVCALAVRGKHAQRASAMGAFGRATCSGPLLQPVQR
ncbi:hypothetical protein [Streptomyces sp. CB03234]|uniref:hypothetical protein n=1 Tax=Streptomyces sp. (strain CB03234) TaxID=1703937 RepID=UPI001F526CB9|nr:hypothetical protein [Streptomyces sp. CB03234]